MSDEQKTTEIYYVLCYNVQNKTWYSAPAMIQALNGGKGEVLEGFGIEGKWRHLEDGLEKDIDFDNTELISDFLKRANGITNPETQELH